MSQFSDANAFKVPSIGLAILRFSEVDRRNPFPLRIFHEAQPGFSLVMN